MRPRRPALTFKGSACGKGIRGGEWGGGGGGGIDSCHSGASLTQAMLMLMKSLKNKFVRAVFFFFRIGFRPFVSHVCCVCPLAVFLPVGAVHDLARSTKIMGVEGGGHIDPYRRDDLMADCLFY